MRTVLLELVLHKLAHVAEEATIPGRMWFAAHQAGLCDGQGGFARGCTTVPAVATGGHCWLGSRHELTCPTIPPAAEPSVFCLLVFSLCALTHEMA